MSSRTQNEKKFDGWTELPGGGRRYWLEVTGRIGWRARYIKEVDANETTLRFHQEIYDEHGKLVRFMRSSLWIKVTEKGRIQT